MARPKRQRRPSMLAESWRHGRVTVRGVTVCGDGGASSGTEVEGRGGSVALRPGPTSSSPGYATSVGPAAWVIPPAPFRNNTKMKKPGSSAGDGGESALEPRAGAGHRWGMAAWWPSPAPRRPDRRRRCYSLAKSTVFAYSMMATG
ncbi:hypothetical protein TRIUR3_30593 [Triticum urartu]|uniref:Uncharacterized protein n=2 Tax=Triticum TaxID=4564 RepID=A0A9R0XX65_TRITD|nr:hypothetical protein TRIUR3_30593 [Triticum urartu]VAI44224.1 unnamed protein product [Triticum turgidum subsp. durum]